MNRKTVRTRSELTPARCLRTSLALGWMSMVCTSACENAWPQPTAWRQALETSAQCRSLGSGLVDHACQHSMSGPFQIVTAEADVDYPSAQPNLNRVHTQYTVTLPAGIGGAHAGTIKYRPQRTGRWVLFASRAIDLSLLNATGEALPSSFMDQVASCTALGIGRVYDLTASETYRLRFDAGSAPQVEVIIEKLEDFEQFYYADGDRDGFGDATMSIRTACAAPSGFVVDDTDCDDENAMVHVDAEERCDDADNDCDGTTDEQLDCAGGSTERDAGATNAAIASTDASTETRDAGEAMNADGAEGASDGGGAASARGEPGADRSSGCQTMALGTGGSNAWTWSLGLLGLALARSLRSGKSGRASKRF